MGRQVSAPVPAIEIADVSKRYGRRWALARVSCALPEGESLLLTGPNGSGKTTLLRLMATALLPTAGSVRILGLDARSERDPIRAQVALLSHANHLYEDLSARQNVALVAAWTGGERDEVDAALVKVGLGGRGHHPVRQFSAGMRKRVGIARLLVKRPRLALLDEPFGELDPSGMAQMEALIRALQEGGTSVVLATHYLEQARPLCQRRLHLDGGRVVQA